MGLLLNSPTTYTTSTQSSLYPTWSDLLQPLLISFVLQRKWNLLDVFFLTLDLCHRVNDICLLHHQCESRRVTLRLGRMWTWGFEYTDMAGNWSSVAMKVKFCTISEMTTPLESNCQNDVWGSVLRRQKVHESIIWLTDTTGCRITS